MSCLLIVNSLQVPWQTISQIPQNKKLSKYAPDFLAYSRNGDKYIFESKGTTQPQTIENVMVKALTQSKSYPEPAEAKFAIVSYFPCGTREMPPFMFIADPPISDIFAPNENNSKLLHYAKALQFAGLDLTMRSYTATLIEMFKQGRADESESNFPMLPRNIGLQRFIREIQRTFEEERSGKTIFNWRNRDYIGQTLRNTEVTSEIFLGIELGTLSQILQLDSSAQDFENEVVTEKDSQISIFSDGTILVIRAETKQKSQ